MDPTTTESARQFHVVDLFIVVTGIAVALITIRQLAATWEGTPAAAVVLITFHGLIVLSPTATLLRLRRAGFRDLYLGEGLSACMAMAATVASLLAAAANVEPVLVMGAVACAATAGVLAVVPKMLRPKTWKVWRNAAPWQHWFGLTLWILELTGFAGVLISGVH